MPCIFLLSCNTTPDILESGAIGCDGQTQGCWRGIYPGQTTFLEAEAMLRSDSDIASIEYTENCDELHCNSDGCYGCLQLLCWETKEVPPLPGCAANWDGLESNAPIEYIDLRVVSSTLHLQDVISHFGEPQASEIYIMQACVTTPRGFTERNVIADTIFSHTIATSVVGWYDSGASGSWALEPDTSVAVLRYYSTDEQLLDSDFQYTPWQGFPVVVGKLEKHCPRTSIFWPFGSRQ
jgi:hypothetical protein